MTNIRFVKIEGKRLRLFEFLVVILVISVLVYVGGRYAKNAFGETKVSIANQYFSVFSRTMANIHALGAVSTTEYVRLNNIPFYLNEKGWPANTDKNLSSSFRNQSAEECQQLWMSVFKNPPPSTLDDKGYNEKIEYRVSLNRNVICRYHFIGKQEVAYFLDYDVSNGAVSVTGY